MRTGSPAGVPADLHTHSVVSDGTESPDRLVESAAAAGLATVALTDHDSTAGWAEAAAAAQRTGLTLIPGMELSTADGPASVHLLAYLFDPADPDLVAETSRIRDARLHRAETIVHRLGKDYALSWEDVLAQTTPGATVGRPHIADALVARGFVPTRSDAFASILHPRAGYYIPHYAPPIEQGIELVRAAGGVPVIAHPATHGRSRMTDERRLGALVDRGLAGVEVDHRENTPSGRLRLIELAQRFGLIMTGSSDYHGEGKPNRLGENTTSAAALAEIIVQGTGSSPVFPPLG
ncbi:PHP domain-containing protein [Mycetocola reblochoni]|uniref:COG0613, Predicted metal-dependent phosphoesterases (PHP family) n=2 Tax=Mycetocola reblochoni TaxID=331618 RepID=A0A1R4J8J0_9MICO|nr:PHP domain-containing protein [Mycetocola reblochoni]RLP70110.1 PHP domain-containing protein [Mycetocola reblochoni]SJN28398.1 COG0613, Predicted metal-dependent phosphoesterases (PHP family) [Mycetocola reblochoni REB411]